MIIIVYCVVVIVQNRDDSKQNNWKQNWIHQINIIRKLFKLIIVQGKMIMITTEIVVKKKLPPHYPEGICVVINDFALL